MTAIAGAPESVTLDGTEFPVAADADVGQMKGGLQNEIKPAGGNTVIIVQRRTLWSADGLTVLIDEARDDMTTLQNLANTGQLFPVVIAYPDGRTYQGNGQIDGEIKHQKGSGVAELTLKGPGTLDLQA